ncbi:cysteine--tRNA ligase 2, cytoplasmic-like [Euphorbia lathyris]|uniref:cysteine--tRNA ligase 2, cytoplasmic-like n=1 Tax=Euphorbia lathyris TaxID=212925 RepID=UPI0033142D0D
MDAERRKETRKKGQKKKLGFRIYNTMSKKVEEFKPLVPGKVGMYVCGVTAYDFSHIGHARAAVVFDILFRYLKHLGYEVTYVRNFTDIDDKIINRANEIGEDPLSLSSRFCKEYLADMETLHCLPPTHQPCVTEHMKQIIDMIAQIIENDFAYVAEGGDVFFSVEKFENYGQLSGQKREHNRAGERVAVDLRKSHPADFALWKASKPGEPSWDSPWGRGRPGWHIECSAMSSCYLTSKFDIHGGGIDLAFPHHENELTQSTAACQESKISYWMHNGHVENNGDKMSKSLGNFFTIRQVTEQYHPLALRYFLMSAHYRSPLNYTITQLENASDSIFNIYQALLTCEEALSLFRDESLNDDVGHDGKSEEITPDATAYVDKLRDDFETKLSDDLKTSHLLTKGAFQEALKFIKNAAGKLLKEDQEKRQQQLLAVESLKENGQENSSQQLSLVRSLSETEKGMRSVLDIVGLLSDHSYTEVLQQLKQKALKRAGVTESELSGLIEERAMARKNNDREKSDQMRDELEKKGIFLMDEGEETLWRPKPPKPAGGEQKPRPAQISNISKQALKAELEKTYS